jgi:hypothetical protein
MARLLVPASKVKAALYWDVAIWALGLSDGAAWETYQKAIHGGGAKRRRADVVSDDAATNTVTSKKRKASDRQSPRQRRGRH